MSEKSLLILARTYNAALTYNGSHLGFFDRQILGTKLLQKLPGGVSNFSIYLSVICCQGFSVTIKDRYMEKLKTLPRSF